jgi:hypothetical protein
LVAGFGVVDGTGGIFKGRSGAAGAIGVARIQRNCNKIREYRETGG